MVQRVGWLGFGGRTFLTKEEHQTYCRRLPVRYPRKNLSVTGVCEICGKPATHDNPLQAAELLEASPKRTLRQERDE
jgi:hypothetical protein